MKTKGTTKVESKGKATEAKTMTTKEVKALAKAVEKATSKPKVEPVKVEAPKPAEPKVEKKATPIKSKGAAIELRQQYFDQHRAEIERLHKGGMKPGKIHEAILVHKPTLKGISQVYYVLARLGYGTWVREVALLAAEQAFIAAKAAPKAAAPKAAPKATKASAPVQATA